MLKGNLEGIKRVLKGKQHQGNFNQDNSSGITTQEMGIPVNKITRFLDYRYVYIEGIKCALRN